MKLHTKKSGSLYKNLKLQTKFTITHLVIATIPMETIKEATDDSLITDVKLYIDIPRTDRIFSNYPMCNTILPINNAWGTYWYGIFNGAPSLRALFCPSFYLGSYEIRHNGEMAYITKSSIIYEGERVPCYLAIYFSQDMMRYRNILCPPITLS